MGRWNNPEYRELYGLPEEELSTRVREFGARAYQLVPIPKTGREAFNAPRTELLIPNPIGAKVDQDARAGRLPEALQNTYARKTVGIGIHAVTVFENDPGTLQSWESYLQRLGDKEEPWG